MSESAEAKMWHEPKTGSTIYLRTVTDGGEGWKVKLSARVLPPLSDYLRESYHSDPLFALQQVTALMDIVPGEWTLVP